MERSRLRARAVCLRSQRAARAGDGGGSSVDREGDDGRIGRHAARRPHWDCYAAMPMQGAQLSNHSRGGAAALIERRLHPAAILLFGSAAGDRLRSDSDLDLAVLLGEGEADAFELAALRVDLAAVV